MSRVDAFIYGIAAAMLLFLLIYVIEDGVRRVMDIVERLRKRTERRWCGDVQGAEDFPDELCHEQLPKSPASAPASRKPKP